MEIWEQQEGEPDISYIRFLYYRNLGPERTLEKAYNSYVYSGEIETTEKAIVTAKKSHKRLYKIPGIWSDDSSKYRWIYRANQYDIHNLSISGKVIIDRVYKSLAVFSEQLLEIMKQGEIRPKNFDQLLEGLTLVANILSPESVEAWRQSANSSDNQPAAIESGTEFNINAGAGERINEV
jgi:hypothetical protein